MTHTSTQLLLIRHGETAWNLDRRVQGHTDIPLNARGRAQAHSLARALRHEPLAAVYTSDLGRAMATAQPLAQALGLQAQAEPGLRERHFGCFEGRTQAEVAQHWPEEAQRWQARHPGWAPAGGESLQRFNERTLDTVRRLALAHPGQHIALVAHGGVLDCLYRAAKGLRLDLPRAWTIGNATINRLMHGPQGLCMIHWGDDRHLEGVLVLDEGSDGARASA